MLDFENPCNILPYWLCFFTERARAWPSKFPGTQARTGPMGPNPVSGFIKEPPELNSVSLL